MARHTVVSVTEISVETTPDGRAYLKLGDGEVRDSVALGEHDEADRIPSLDSLVPFRLLRPADGDRGHGGGGVGATAGAHRRMSPL